LILTSSRKKTCPGRRSWTRESFERLWQS
jgi:hypothetical protein